MDEKLSLAQLFSNLHHPEFQFDSQSDGLEYSFDTP
jgi:hypothetical protein